MEDIAIIYTFNPVANVRSEYMVSELYIIRPIMRISKRVGKIVMITFEALLLLK